MPTAFEREQARQAALAANAARFTGRPTVPPRRAPLPQATAGRINMVELEALWNTGGIFRFNNPVRLEEEFQLTPPPPPPPNKTVTFEGMELEVPHWTGFVTQSKDGTITAWAFEPFYREEFGYHSIGHFPQHKVIMKPEEYPERIETV